LEVGGECGKWLAVLRAAMGEPSHTQLVAWQRADDLFVHLHSVVRDHFPEEERYCLTSQLRRAALSVPANIVEADARFHDAEKAQLLRTAWASLQESGYYLHVARRLGYISDAKHRELEGEVKAVAAPLAGLIRRFRR
jgi:four helix bundle protein